MTESAQLSRSRTGLQIVASVISAGSLVLAVSLAARAGNSVTPNERDELGESRVVATETIGKTYISWDSNIDFRQASLSVTGKNGIVFQDKWGPGGTPALSIYDGNGEPLPDGAYRYEIIFETNRPVQLDEVTTTQPGRHGVAMKRVAKSGALIVQNGSIVPRSIENDLSGSSNSVKSASERFGTKDTFGEVVASSLCANSGCSEPESYGVIAGWNVPFKLERNAPSPLLFSNTDSDWRSWAIIPGSGGFGSEVNNFIIQDRGTTGGSDLRPFHIEGGAPTDALRISSDGSVGLGTATPRSPLDINNTFPGITMENVSEEWRLSAFSDTGGAFGVRNVTDSTHPFVVHGDAPQNALRVEGSGTGLGTSTPADPLHVFRSGGETAAVRVETTGGTASNRRLFFLRNNGNPIFRLENTNSGSSWDFRMNSPGFSVTRVGSGTLEMSIENDGDLSIAGTLTEGSSRAIKHDITELDGRTVLAKLEELPVSEWSYDASPGERHAGPMAEDFYATFGLGPDNRHIAPKDLAGVALAAAKALKAENDRLRAKIAKLEGVESRLSEIESRLAEMK